MSNVIEFEWERIAYQEENQVYWFATYRAKVIGGWLVRTFDFTKGVTTSTSESTTFVPDRIHEWQIKKPQVDAPAEERSEINPELF